MLHNTDHFKMLVNRQLSPIEAANTRRLFCAWLKTDTPELSEESRDEIFHNVFKQTMEELTKEPEDNLHPLTKHQYSSNNEQIKEMAADMGFVLEESDGHVYVNLDLTCLLDTKQLWDRNNRRNMSNRYRTNATARQIIKEHGVSDTDAGHRVFLTKRGHPLLTTQTLPDTDIVTLENYEKWYDIYLLKSDGTIETITEYATDYSGLWIDHRFHPRLLLNIARDLGAVADVVALETAAGRWIMESDEDHDFEYFLED